MGSREELLFSPHSLKKPVFSPHEEALTKLVVCLIQIVKEPKLPTLSYRYFLWGLRIFGRSENQYFINSCN